jgi:predicted methyltransferase
MIRTVMTAFFAATLTCVPAIAQTVVPAPAGAAIARPDADQALDANRKPAAVIAFAGVKPGMVIAELAPGGGYYTRVLAQAVGPTGKIYALVGSGQAARPGGLDKLNAVASAYPNVKILVVDYPAVMLPEPADMFWTTENYHDFHNGPTADIAALDKSVFSNLKSGGIFYVEDHRAAPGAGLAATSKNHRMDEAIAKSELTAAGFVVDAESNILKNPADDPTKGNSETGHFASDRFMLRLKRP